jgi:hypothetical protein
LTEALAKGDASGALAVATPFLRLAGLTIGGALITRTALPGSDERNLARAQARFFCEALLGETAHLADVVRTGAPALADGAAAVIGIG